MSGLLIDSDIFLLLAGADALDRSLELLGMPHDKTFRLGPLPQIIGRNAKVRERFSAEIRNRALTASYQFKGVGWRPGDDLFQRLVQVPDIDEGEALLYGVLAEERHYLLASGDKRAMIALCSEASLGDVRRAVAGRVICLESIVRAMAIQDGIEATSAMFTPVIPASKTLQVLFSEANRNDHEEFLRAADSYLIDLKAKLGADFLREV